MVSESLTLVLLVAVLAAVGAVAVLNLRGRRREDALATEAEALRGRVSQLDRDLATQTAVAARVPGLEEEVRGKADAERALAVEREARSRTEQQAADIQARLTAAETALGVEKGRLEATVRETAQLEAKIAEQGAGLRTAVTAQQDLQGRLAAAEAAGAATLKDLAAAREQLATLNEALEQERKQSADKLAAFTEMRTQLTGEFKLLANEVLKSHGESFSKSNQEQVDALLNPMRLKLTEFQDVLRVANEQTIRERAALGEQIKSLSEASSKMSTETLNLTRALKGEAQVQGAWGEMILASILERSGLRKDAEYFTQVSHTDDEGSRLRPDVIVRLPNGQRVVIDSKVSLVAFEAHVAAETDGQRTEALRRHVGSIKTHIQGLSAKKYQDVSDLDYVVMFVPIEGALALALQGDAEITSFAVANNVAIATPTTLMIALRTVANVWDVERRNLNAEAIAERAGRLYDKFVGFLDDMGDVGLRLQQATKAHDAAMGKLKTGGGNLVRQTEQLKALGAKTGNKQIPAALLEESVAAVEQA